MYLQCLYIYIIYLTIYLNFYCIYRAYVVPINNGGGTGTEIIRVTTEVEGKLKRRSAVEWFTTSGEYIFVLYYTMTRGFRLF